MTAMKLRLSIAFLTILVSTPVFAVEVKPYTDPLPLGGYIDDVDALLVAAFSYDGWQAKSRLDDNNYLAFISYKDYDVTVRIEARDGALSLRLVSVFDAGCAEQCRSLGEEPALRWLVNLRRTIAYELTLAVRDHLQEQTG